MGSGALDPRVVGALREIVGAEHVVTDPEVTASYSLDWTGRFRGSTPAVVRPADATEARDVVALARRAGFAIVPQGGNTGMVGGGVPLHGEVVLSLRRLDRIDLVDAAAGQVTAQAGVTISTVQRAARAAGWEYGVDLGARDSATVGGNVATNAGGLRVLRYGDTRAQLLGAEAVLGSGAIVSHLGGLVKDNTGYSWHGLLCGSEGTLAVVTAARLRLVPNAPARVVALLGFASPRAAVAAAQELCRSLTVLSALELMVREGVDLVCEVTRMAHPLSTDHAAYLLVEAAGTVDPTGDLEAAVSALSSVEAAAVATDSARIAALWRYREAHTEAINAAGPPHKLDVTLPAAALAEMIDRVPHLVAAVAPRARVFLFGHVGDGNVHVNVTGIDPEDERVDDAIFTAVAEVGGSISAEHGIGTAKTKWLHLNRSQAELDAFAALKGALDPDSILNPYVLRAPHVWAPPDAVRSQTSAT